MDIISTSHSLRFSNLAYPRIPPFLPRDLQLIIVTLAVRGDRKRCLRFMKVSRDFAVWVRPLLYEFVHISKYLQLCWFVVARRERLTRFSMARNLFISTPYDSAFDAYVLNACGQVQSLALRGDSLRGVTHLTQRGVWATVEVACKPSSVFLFHTNCELFQQRHMASPAILRNCTHLAIEPTSVDIRCISYLLNITPTVTHLALLFTYPRLYAIHNAKEFCEENPQLSSIVLCHFIQRSRPTSGDLWAITSFGPHGFEQLDSRVALVEILKNRSACASHWRALACGSLDIWGMGKARREAIDGRA
ncbi:hypothetical protein SISNIDRAFT_469438 [Sistotremastrum niveocremeum HHB9708]|uniref:F-box domain-containing protein n=1 Tax=Sistotremastrum niveocremeum HHB9708 TaxID=1314777 RepID=A0A164Q866_9AGAM|nr:hypothetical protein SISNIDRAFT_469438 [Sistotremastrum niveocremeum HHB9708]